MQTGLRKLLTLIVGVYLIGTTVGVAMVYYHPEIIRFDSPDETANFFWIQRLADGESLRVPEALNEIAANQIHPRSINVTEDGSLVPGTFLGFILLLGFIGKIFGATATLFVTPVLGALGGLALFGIVRRLFDEKIATLSVAFVLLSPLWLYYSVTSLYTNIAFVSLVIIGIYFLISLADSLTTARSLLAGATLALAASIRPNEVIWIALLALVVVIAIARDLRLKQLITMALATTVVVVPQFLLQQQLFGSSFATGYNQLHLIEQQCTACRVTQGLTIPFGFHPRVAALNLWHYFIQPFWWIVLAGAAGVFAWFGSRHRFIRSELQKHWIVLILSLMISTFLIIYYGSLPYGDPAIAAQNRIGLSFVRYWLPAVVFAAPWIAYFVYWFVARLPRRAQWLAYSVVIVGWLVVGYWGSVLPKNDGLRAMDTRMDAYRSYSNEFQQITPEDAVIVTTRTDKIIFPQRQVIHTYVPFKQNPELQEIVEQLKQIVPVYIWSESTGLSGYIGTVGQESLYRVE